MFLPPPGMSGGPRVAGLSARCSFRMEILPWGPFVHSCISPLAGPSSWCSRLSGSLSLPGAGSATVTQCHGHSQSDPDLCEGQGEQGLCSCQGLWRAGEPVD